MMDAWRMELTQTIAKEVNIALTRQQWNFAEQLTQQIDSMLSNFQKNIQQFRIRNSTGLKRI